MEIRISPSNIGGEIYAPPSKSCMHRALICAAAAERPTKIICDSFSKDTEATMNCLEALGARFEISDGETQVYPIEKNSDEECILDCNESGSTLRFMLPFAAALGRKCTFIGAERLGKRPLLPLCEAMAENGVTPSCGEDFLPCSIEGKLKKGIYKVPGNISSQFITGLLLALGITSGEIQLTTPLESAPYIEITTDIQEKFGIKTEKTDSGYKVECGQRYTSPEEFKIEGDWSNGAFWLVAGAIGSSGGIRCTSLKTDSLQGDRKALEILRLMGADVTETDSGIFVKKSYLKAVEADCADIPDIVPILCVAACAAEGTTVFKNIGRLRAKESDRVLSTADMINKLGGKISFDENTIEVTGAPLKGGRINSYNDHRIAMSAAVASLICSGDVIIENAEAVEKSYPDFYEKFKTLGGILK